MVQDNKSDKTKATEEARKKSNAVNLSAAILFTLIFTFGIFVIFDLGPNLIWFHTNVKEGAGTIQDTVVVVGPGKNQTKFILNVKYDNGGETESVEIANSWSPLDFGRTEKFAQAQQFAKNRVKICFRTSGYRLAVFSGYKVAVFKEGTCPQ